MHALLKAAASLVAIVALDYAPMPASANTGPVNTFDFTFPSCLGVVASDNPFHVTTTSLRGLPRIDNHPAGAAVISLFHDAGTYTAKPSGYGRPRAGWYDDRYEAVATGPVTYDSTGAIATAGRLTERRDIVLWDGTRFFFHESWAIDAENYNENTTAPTIFDTCRP